MHYIYKSIQITEKYAFLPREAVTKFLLQCTECQKRGSPGIESTSTGSSGGSLSKIFAVDRSLSPLSPIATDPASTPPISSYSEKSPPSEFDINFSSLPFSTTTTRRTLLPSYLAHDEFAEERKQSSTYGGGDGSTQDEHVDEVSWAHPDPFSFYLACFLPHFRQQE